MILVAWLSILWLVVKLLGPVIADFLDAQRKEFAENNPQWSKPAEDGLSLLKDLGLKAVAAIEGRTYPKDLEQAQRWLRMAADAKALLRDLARSRGLTPDENELKRTVEEAVTALNQGKRARGL